MKVGELMSKCYNCDYYRTNVTVFDGHNGMMQGVPNAIPERVKNMYVRSFKTGRMKNGRFETLVITIEGSDKL